MYTRVYMKVITMHKIYTLGIRYLCEICKTRSINLRLLIAWTYCILSFLLETKTPRINNNLQNSIYSEEGPCETYPTVYTGIIYMNHCEEK